MPTFAAQNPLSFKSICNVSGATPIAQKPLSFKSTLVVPKPLSLSFKSIICNASGVKGNHIGELSAQNDIIHSIQSFITEKPEVNTPFCVLDSGVVKDLMDNWTAKLPTVQPFYAVKCNPNLSFIGTLAALGANFDCASKAEIESVLSLGVSPERIIYANPCKFESHIQYAASVGVNLTTYDSIEEVEKIRKWHPKCELILRIKPPTESGYALGLKYGAHPEEVPELLKAAQTAKLKVSGVAFHIGTGAADMRPFDGAIAAAKSVFETASLLGMPRMRILDIGGGFTVGPLFDAAAVTINAAIEAHFGNEEGLLVVGEPGNYFAQTAFTLVTRIFGKRVRGEVREYWIDDGMFGTLNFRLVEDGRFECMPFACSSKPKNPVCKGSRTYPSTVFGPTCDSTDTVLQGYQLPDLQVNDWLVFPNIGAYSICAETTFNGFSSSANSIYLACSSQVAPEATLI